MKWENLSQLVNICKDKINEYSHFTAKLRMGFDEKVELYDKKNVQILTE